MREILIAISTGLVLVSSAIYIRSIRLGISKPHRTTRFVLMAITLLSVAALFSDLRSAAFWLALVSALQGVVIFLLSLKKGMGGWSKLDISCLIIATFGIILWQTTGYPIVGLYASIVADAVGMMPAYVKTYKRPDTEDWRFFGIDTVAPIFSLFALTSFTAYSLAYPIYIFLINAGMVILIFMRKQSLATENTS